MTQKKQPTMHVREAGRSKTASLDQTAFSVQCRTKESSINIIIKHTAMYFGLAGIWVGLITPKDNVLTFYYYELV